MEVARVECLTADAGWRIHDFIKVTLSDGLIGWSEFSRAFGSPGVGEAIAQISSQLVGLDPRSEHMSAKLRECAQQSGVAYQACGALENAMLDVRARAIGVPVYELLGSVLRDRIRLYWGHCGTYRTSHAEVMQKPPIADPQDVVHLGREVVERGYTALKMNPLVFGDGSAWRYTPERAAVDGHSLIDSLRQQLAALREGAGSAVAIMIDIGSKVSASGALEIACAAEPYRPTWLEIDLADLGAVRTIAEHSPVPVAGGERLQAADYHDLLERAAVDIPVVDLLSNGLERSIEIASMSAEYGKNIAVHNCYSPLATMMAANLCAVVPNLYMLEHDVDAVPWDTQFVTSPPEIQHGFLSVPTSPGWGTEVDEAAVRAHPLLEPA